MTLVKICGVTNADDALVCVDLGADAIGINFYSGSARCVSEAQARAIADAVRGRALLVGVFVNERAETVRSWVEQLSLGCVQFHGDEPPEYVEAFLPHAYRAFRVRGADVLDEVRRFSGEHVLLDAYVPGVPGGTGATFDWELAAVVARERKVTLAGGLGPENVDRAVHAVRPFCVDVASGVESRPGIKDVALVRRFVEAVKGTPK